ncbi:MAG: mycofactocin biosynthesis glycosyltransferase MftF, partial [Deltaproteobacteria bacterium]|nr:mycofactocin biosynthesis glycosyltransferase MftF [Deltaproteobacteria bacterium]
MMNSQSINDQRSGELSYRFRKNVRYFQDHGRPIFMLSYPLKVVRLHPAWNPVGERFLRGDFVPLSKLDTIIGVAGDRTRLFLDDLVRKGFLETQGVLPLFSVPMISVIIPVHNRPDEIRSCLEALLQVDYPREKVEILVVDDASTDSTPEVVSEFPVTLIRLSENRQAPFCRNLGSRRACGEILAFIDSDCLASPPWLRELVPVFNDRSVAAVGGKVDSYYDRKGLDRYEQVMSSLNGGDWPRRSTEKEPFFYVPSCNFLVRKEVFLSVGGFQEELVVGEDVDLCWRLQDQGHPVEYRPVGIVRHRHRNRLKAFCSRRFDYGTSEPLLQKRHPQRIKTFGFPLTGALFFALLILSLVLTSWPPAVAGALVTIMDAAARKRRLRLKDLPLAFIRILAATLRDYTEFIYQCCAFLSRYYLAAGLLFMPFLPRISILILGAQVLVGSVVYIGKRPRLNFLYFQFFFLLEQLSYQSGVWWGCLKNLHFNPVAPKLAGTWTSQGNMPWELTRLTARLVWNGVHFQVLKRTGQTGRLQSISLEVTHDCLARCIMCNIWKIPPEVPNLSIEAWLQLLHSPILSDLVEMDITGGEPFLLKNLPDLFRGIAGLKAQHLKTLKSVAVTTNGLLTKRVLEFTNLILREFEPAGLDLVVVCAVDATGPIHDAV